MGMEGKKGSGVLDYNKNSQTSADKEFKDRCWDEYRILQEKIDKIGDFRFRVKGWSVSIIVAVMFTGFASKVPPWSMLMAIPLIFLFQSVEAFQDRNQGAYVERVRVIEGVLNRKPRSGKIQTPCIGRTIGRAFGRAKKSEPPWQRLLVGASIRFYWLLYVIIIVGFFLKVLNVSNAGPSNLIQLKRMVL